MLDAGAAAVWRRDRARRTLARLADDVAAWQRSAMEPAHASQVAAVLATLGALLDRLRAIIDGLGDTAAALADAARVERDTVVVERAWRYYADRLAQRRGPAGAALAIADELLWSCTAVTRAVTGAALSYPLACVEPAYSASALPRDARPRELAPVDRSLAAVLRAMPVPLVALPTAFAAEPWWMILATHEVGHIVQLEAEADDAVGERTRALVEAAGGEAWGDWHREIFADAFAVAAVGPIAIRAFAELEWGSDAEMTAARPGYPPVATRLAIMTEVGRALDLPVDDQLVPAVAARAGAVAVARSLAAMPIGTGTLAALATACRSAIDDTACADVLGGRRLTLTASRERPLRAIAAAFRGYARLLDEPDATVRVAQADALARRIGALVTDVRDPEIRRAAVAPTTAAAGAARLARALRAGDDA